MAGVETDLKSYLELIDSGDTEKLVRRLKELKYEDRISILEKKMKWGKYQEEETLLTRLVSYINTDSYKQKKSDNNPVERILLDVRPEDRLRLLRVGGDWLNGTPLHVACGRDDRETVEVIISSVDEVQRSELLSTRTGDGDRTVLHLAAGWAGLDTCRFVFNCVTPERIIRLLMLGDRYSETPLHYAVWINKHPEVLCGVDGVSCLSVRDSIIRYFIYKLITTQSYIHSLVCVQISSTL